MGKELDRTQIEGVLKKTYRTIDKLERNIDAVTAILSAIENRTPNGELRADFLLYDSGYGGVGVTIDTGSDRLDEIAFLKTAGDILRKYRQDAITELAAATDMVDRVMEVTGLKTPEQKEEKING